MDYDEDPEAEQKSNASGYSTSLIIINEQTADTATQVDDGSEKMTELADYDEEVD